MLKIVNSLESWVFSELLSICGDLSSPPEVNVGTGADSNPVIMHKQQAYYQELISFINEDEGKLLFWQEQDEFVSVCRIETEQDRCLLHDLATKASARRKGYGKKLLLAAIEYLRKHEIRSVFVHVKKNNKPSIALHTTVGFVKVKDTARLLDGTVSSAYITMEYQIK